MIDDAPLVISRGPAAGTYQAFPDVCRLHSGDILAVFYAGYDHVSLPKMPDWPNGGRLCQARSQDAGRTWSEPTVLYDDSDDNRDPSIAQMPDGSLICTFFSLRPAGPGAGETGVSHTGAGLKIVRSQDEGRTWDQQAQTLLGSIENWYCSAPVRVLPDGTCLLGVYYHSPTQAYGGVIRSTDQGRTWEGPIPIGKGQGVRLDAETDVIALKDGTIFAALRCDQPGAGMYYATSADAGKTWTPVKDIGFPGHAPYLSRLRDGTILLAHRLPNTALHISRDETRSWQGPYVIDDVFGAYPSIVELKDGSVLIAYYTEGKGSAVRVRRFRIHPDGIEALPRQ